MSAEPPPPFGYGVYEPPRSEPGRPTIILLFRVYAVVAALVFAGTAALLPWAYVPETGDAPRLIACLVAAGAALPFVVGAAVPYRPWGWSYAHVLLWLSVFSCMTLFAIPLLVYWREPTTKAAFQRFF